MCPLYRHPRLRRKCALRRSPLSSRAWSAPHFTGEHRRFRTQRRVILAPLPAVSVASGHDTAPWRERLVRGRDQRSLTGDSGEDSVTRGHQGSRVSVGWTPIGMLDFAGVMNDVSENVKDLTCRFQTNDTMSRRLARGRYHRHPRRDLLLPIHELQQPESVDELQTVQVRAGRAPARIPLPIRSAQKMTRPRKSRCEATGALDDDAGVVIDMGMGDGDMGDILGSDRQLDQCRSQPGSARNRPIWPDTGALALPR